VILLNIFFSYIFFFLYIEKYVKKIENYQPFIEKNIMFLFSYVRENNFLYKYLRMSINYFFLKLMIIFKISKLM